MTMVRRGGIRLVAAVAFMVLAMGAAGVTIHRSFRGGYPSAVKSIGDSVCTVSDSVTVSNGIAVVDFVLRPEAESYIRCRIVLPPPEAWNGEFWGTGNSSFGGVLPPVYELAAAIGAASATTDLGTSRYSSGEGRKQPIPAAVLHDYSWRATHLMTVYGKRIVKAFYGREPHHSYFRGGSCGGRQGLSEAMRFPSDYDGILSSLPAGFSTISSAQFLNLYRQTHDDDGRALFTREQLRVVADAPIEYMKDRDPKPYAGKVLANPIFHERDIDGFLAIAAKNDPSLADPELMRRLKNIFTGVSRNGKTICHGMLPGAYFGWEKGRNFNDRGGSLMTLRYRRQGFGKVASWEDYEDEVARSGGLLNACSTDLGAFRGRGGKLMVVCGWEDQTTPSPEMLAWYEMLSERNGGYEKTGEFCRLFALPGCAHGGGKGRISTGGSYTVKHLELLRRWVEKGEAPDAYPHEWKAEKLTIPVPPYPLMCYQDDAGNWKTKRYPEGLLRRPDPAYLPCDLAPVPAKEDGFKAGFARVDITPPVGVPLAGYYHRRVSDGVLDPLYARCLAISDGETRALVFSIDNVHLSNEMYDEVRAAVSRRTGLPLEAVFLACTHTHTGPVSRVPKKAAPSGASKAPDDADFTQASNKLTAERCADAGEQALADLAPAKIMIGRGEAKGISFVRRYKMKDGTVRTNPGVGNPNIERADGEPDEQLQLVRFVREGKPEIALVNFQCHPDSIGGTKISADWPGLSCGYLEAAMSGSVRAIFVNGAEGDTNGVNVNGEAVKKGYERAKHMARVVAGAALAAWGRCETVDAGKISTRAFGVKAATNKGTEEEAKKARECVNLHKAGRISEIPLGIGKSRTATVAEAYRILHTRHMPDEVELPVSMVSIGKSIAFCGFPGEPFTWMGKEVKERSPFRMTIPACCVNGSYGYFPVKSAFTTGGYENATARYRAGTAEKLVAAALKELAAAHAGE